MIEELPLEKLIVERAIQFGKTLKSEETGFLHFNYEKPFLKVFQTIPVYENLLFALALFKSHKVEQIQEAKLLLKRVLGFQNPLSGGFPLYLHEYPETLDSAHGVRLLAPFYWILKEYGHILGELKAPLSEAVSGALRYSLKESAEKRSSYSQSVLLSSALLALGSFFEHSEWVEEGQRTLDLLAFRQLDGWLSTTHIGEMVIGLQMALPFVPADSWKPFWEMVEKVWDKSLGAYTGPSLREWFEKGKPKKTFFSLFCQTLMEEGSKELPSFVDLEGVLIQFSNHAKSFSSLSCSIKGSYRGALWETVKEHGGSLTFLEKKEIVNQAQDATYTPFSFSWKEGEELFSFACQGSGCKAFSWEKKKEAYLLSFELAHHREINEDKRQDLCFYLSFHPSTRLFYEGRPVNTFELDQKLELRLGQKSFFLKFNSKDRDRVFAGQLIRGCRPAEIERREEAKFEAYDTILFLREIGKPQEAFISLELSFS